MLAYLVNKRLMDYESDDSITVFVTMSKEKAFEEAMRLFIINYEAELGMICRWAGSLACLDNIRKSVSYDPEQNSLDLMTTYDDNFSLEIDAFIIDKRYAIS